MKIAVIGPASVRDIFLPYLEGYGRAMCVDTEVYIYDHITDMEPLTWDLALIYTYADDYETYLQFCEEQKDCNVVLWSEDSTWARVGLRSHSCGFILLPVAPQVFASTMRKCPAWTKHIRSFRYSSIKSTRPIREVEVTYIESVGHVTIIHTLLEDISVTKSLSSFAKDLGESFLRCQRSYVVNMRYVASIKGEMVTLMNGTKLPVSPNREEEYKARWEDYAKMTHPLMQGEVRL